MSCFVIAEAGVNHNGDRALALELVDVAAAAGADAVKFQSFTAERLVRPDAATVAYQRATSQVDDQHALLKPLELSPEAHRAIVTRCIERGIEFMSTPFDIDAARMLVDLGMRRIKVPSGELTNLPFLRELCRLHRPLIVSTGMASLDEIIAAVETIRDEWQTDLPADDGIDPLVVLHCTSNYPASLETANLRAMATIRQRLDVPVGYSDHTHGLLAPVIAVALGAVVLEKHFTADRTLPGPDHQASLEPAELTQLVREVRAAETSLGSGVKEPLESELPVRAAVRRSIALARALPAGAVLQRTDLVLLRPADGIAPADLERVVGARLAVERPAFAALRWEDIAP